MVSAELKSMVAQNCEEYEAPVDIRLLSNSASSISCENCANYTEGQCRRNHFQKISDIFNRN